VHFPLCLDGFPQLLLFQLFDIAVITGSASGYNRLIPGIFEEYGIPVFIDTKRDILSHPLTELIRSVTEVAASNWSYESVFKFLKTGMTDILEDDIFELENYCLAYGIKHHKWKYKEWKPGGDHFDLLHINEIKNHVIELLLPFTQDIKPNTEMSILDFSKKIFLLLESLNAADKIASHGQPDIRKQSQVWKAVCGMFDKLVEILGNETVNAKGFAKILDTGLAALDIGILPPTKDQVIAGDLERSRLPSIKALFVLNVNEGILPASAKESGFLTDADRARISRVLPCIVSWWISVSSLRPVCITLRRPHLSEPKKSVLNTSLTCLP